MSQIEALRSSLVREEVNYRKQVGRPPMHQVRNGVLESIHPVPPKLRYTLSDPYMFVGDKAIYTQGAYFIEGESGDPVYVYDNDWSIIHIDFVFYRSDTGGKTFMYEGCIFGDAVLVFRSATDETLGFWKVPAEYDSIDNALYEIWDILLEKTSYILASVYMPGVKKNYGITIQDFKEFDITDFVHSDTDFEVAQIREKTSGVVKESTFDLQLTGIAKRFVQGVFFIDKLRGNVQLNIYVREASGRVYNKEKVEVLSFPELEFSNTVLKIQTLNLKLTEYVNSNGKVKYDIPVADIKSSKQWKYDRVTMENRGNYEMPVGLEYNFTISTESRTQPYIYLSSSEITPGTAEHDMKTQSSQAWSEDNYFFEAASTVQPSIVADFKMLRHWNNVASRPDLDYVGYLMIIKNDDFDNPIYKEQFELESRGTETGEDGQTNNFAIYSKIVKQTITLSQPLVAGDKLTMLVDNVSSNGDPNEQNFGGSYISEFNDFRIVYTSKGSELALDVIEPTVLANKLLARMTNNQYSYQCVINWNTSLSYKPLICAAETLRGLDNANIHTSMSDFMNWMYANGYEYVLADYTLTFSPRDTLYQKDVTALTLKSGEVKDVLTKASKEFAYTSVQVGYDMEDYESANGRFEINGTFEYSTDYVNFDDNTLNLISPYRADAVGMELLCWERGNSSKDKSSDNDVFVIAMTEEDTYYRYYDDYMFEPGNNITGDIRFFNAVLNPAFLIQLNESLIGINTDKLIFASTTSNRSGIIWIKDADSPGGWRKDESLLYTDKDIQSKLFEPYEYDFVTGNFVKLPDVSTWNGLIMFYNGRTKLRGFVKEIMKNYSNNTESTWILYAVEE
ncbi:hypothetical protein [Dysgonomonas macrotermitis]|uniref:Uncharacterized protein n=1 Tax=Dysgonomonas macrotermitis TaxID=1346286 RepID=A0A1M5C5S2_9BACT|nr:hypothetical protein [Dysgonomonas macrotermitis]SHF50089.1 hypothetical protein SAMN05444362_10741 [Dysgonomonas macrotermitis]